MNEQDIVAKLQRLASREQLRNKLGQGLTLGIGDDCAIYRPLPGEDLILTTDQMIEGVHFLRSHAPTDLGHRALARSLSDIAAMGGEPRFCLVALAVPTRILKNAKWIEDFYGGLLRLGRKTFTALAGGDLAHDPDRIHCDVMVCGVVRGGKGRSKALRRDGARPGDLVYVSGRLGKPWERRIEPRLALGQSLVGRATSCIDISDGLSLDLHRLCLASGVGARVDRVPVARGSTLDRALHGGEDYELLFTLPNGTSAPRGVTQIGEILRGKPGAVTFQGKTLKPSGYDHFRKRESEG